MSFESHAHFKYENWPQEMRKNRKMVSALLAKRCRMKKGVIPYRYPVFPAEAGYPVSRPNEFQISLCGDGRVNSKNIMLRALTTT